MDIVEELRQEASEVAGLYNFEVLERALERAEQRRDPKWQYARLMLLRRKEIEPETSLEQQYVYHLNWYVHYKLRLRRRDLSRELWDWDRTKDRLDFQDLRDRHRDKMAAIESLVRGNVVETIRCFA